MRPESSVEIRGLNFATHEGPPPEYGAAAFEREIDSAQALVTPVVIGAVRFLRQASRLEPGEENQVALCLEEALQNAILHGNKEVFEKKVRLSIFARELETLFVVWDEGPGFDVSRLKSPVCPETVWEESGRGLFLIAHYMDRVEFYAGGRALVMARSTRFKDAAETSSRD